MTYSPAVLYLPMRRITVFCIAVLLVSSCKMFNATFKDAIDFNLKVYLVDNWNMLKQAVEDPSGPELIAVAKSFTIPELELNIEVTRPVTLTSYGGEHTIKRPNQSFHNNFFTIRAGGSLVLGHLQGESLVLDGNPTVSLLSPGVGRFVYVGLNGSCIMKDGITLRGNNGRGAVAVDGGVFYMEGGAIHNNTASAESAVLVGAGSSFVMSGGTIRNNTAGAGGGVSMSGAGSSFVMNGGVIHNNTTISGAGGGVVAGASSSFVMNGGTIAYNTAAAHGGGVYGTGSGVALTMNGGTINGNTSTGDGGGVYATTFIMYGGTISGNNGTTGGGVRLNGMDIFIMDGGTITGNTSTGDGGGVHYGGSNSVVLSGTASISRNIAGGGGGGLYYNGGGSVNLSGTAAVSDNESTGSGGGIYATVNAASGFSLSGAVHIAGNRSAASGAGIFLTTGASAAVTISGGTIENNTEESAASTIDGGGAHLSISGSLTISGGTIANNAARITAAGSWAANGSGLFLLCMGTVNLNGLTISGNTASCGAGGVTRGGGLYLDTAGTVQWQTGTISGNRAEGSGYGGGIYIHNGIFRKTGGIIYGSDTVPENRNFAGASTIPPSGYAVYHFPNSRYRNTTAGASPGGDLSSNLSGLSGGWD